MKIYFRVTLFDFAIFPSLVNSPPVYEKINKCSYILHTYGKSMKVHKLFPFECKCKDKNIA